MKLETIEKAIELGSGLGHVFIATADAEGLPHMAASGRLTAELAGSVSISEWYCPGTVENLQINPRISIVVWDPESDTGYQILGNCEKVEDLSMMDGLSPELEKKDPLPQVERKILVRVSKVVRFSYAPHSDVEE
jgi:hypothetical protein